MREPLDTVFRRLIAHTGPISIAQYMAEANAHYYATRDPLGVVGDFITAPEISQMFGEMIGIWCADIWARAGRPEGVRYVEAGPGRGTLARDALRVMARFGLTPQVHFIEISPVLRRAQAQLGPDARWHDSLGRVPGGAPMLLVANEFLDALPVRQLVKTPAGWRERMVGVVDGRFTPVAGTLPMDAAIPPEARDAPPGTIIETSPAASALVGEAARMLARDGGAGLIIDYGYTLPQTGSTLQAVRAHAKADPFAAPGEADLTTLVDFAAAAGVASRAGARVLGTAGQGAWLHAMGIAQRAVALAKAQPTHAAAINEALTRLTAPDQMGTLFQVMGLAAPHWPDGAGWGKA